MINSGLDTAGGEVAVDVASLCVASSDGRIQMRRSQHESRPDAGGDTYRQQQWRDRERRVHQIGQNQALSPRTSTPHHQRRAQGVPRVRPRSLDTLRGTRGRLQSSPRARALVCNCGRPRLAFSFDATGHKAMRIQEITPNSPKEMDGLRGLFLVTTPPRGMRRLRLPLVPNTLRWGVVLAVAGIILYYSTVPGQAPRPFRRAHLACFLTQTGSISSRTPVLQPCSRTHSMTLTCQRGRCSCSCSAVLLDTV